MKSKPPVAICVALTFSLAACTTRETITEINPYSSMVAQRFVLKEDCYTYYYNGHRKQLAMGTPKVNSYLPRDLNPKDLPRRFGSITVNGVVRQGSTFSVVKIVRSHNIEGSWYEYLANVILPEARLSMVDVSPIMDLTKHPPVVIKEIASEQ